jgi:hypothetical protein
VVRLRTAGSQLQCVIRDILYNFFKFNVHIRLQSYGLTVQQELTVVRPAKACVVRLRTTRSLLERIIRDIHHNNFVQFNVHIRLQG